MYNWVQFVFESGAQGCTMEYTRARQKFLPRPRNHEELPAPVAGRVLRSPFAASSRGEGGDAGRHHVRGDREDAP